MTTMLAIDASTTAVGWAVFRDGEYAKSGVYKPIGEDAWERIQDYEDWVEGWWFPPPSPLPRPDTVAYELATGNRGNMRTNRLMGALEYATRQNIACRLVTVTASQVRASGCHKHALAVASAIAGKEITSGDEADAIGCGLAALAKMQREGA